MRVVGLLVLLPLLALLPAPAEAISPAAIAAELTRMRSRPRPRVRRSVVETNTHGEADRTTTISHGGEHAVVHGEHSEHGAGSAHSGSHGDVVTMSYCVESEEVHESHGIHVASWRWTEVQTYYAITLFIVIAGLAKLAFHHAHFLSSKLPESCLLIILGIFMGIITYHIRHRVFWFLPGYRSGAGGAPNDGNEDGPNIRFENGTVVPPCEDEFAGFFPKFDAELFFLVLLPPIVLEASYSLHDRAFMDNLGSVLIFAVVGTLFNMFIISPALWGLAKAGAMGSSMIPADHYDVSQISLVQMLTFGSLIVAVDPVAVLAIFQEVGVNKDLYFLVFGESLLNDAVTVVLYNAMVVFANSEDVPVTYDQVLLAIAAFFCVSLGGLAIGIVFGVLTAIITKYTPDVRVVEPLSLLAMAYLAYLSAELVHFSGIIACVGCGVVQAHYAMKNISKNSYITIKYFITMASSTSDTIIFMFLGMVLVSDDHKWHTGFALWTLVLCLVVRFVGVYLLCWMANFRRLRRIGKKEQFIMAYGGLRGAVGFSLVVMLRDSQIDPMTVRIFVTTTLFIILFTVFIQGSTIKLLVSLFNIKLEETEDPTLAEEIAATTVDHITAGVEEIIGYRGTNFFKERLEHFDEKYLKPLLISDSLDSSLARLYDKLVLDEHYANLYGPAAAAETKKVDIVGSGEGDFFLPEEEMVHLRRRQEALRRQLSQQSSIGARPLSRLGTLRERLSRRLSTTSASPAQAQSVDVEHGSGTAPGTPLSGRFNPDDNYKTFPADGHLLRKAFRSNPYNKLHLRYNPNLIDEEDQEIDTHLRRRRMNAQRFSQIAQLALQQERAEEDAAGPLRRTASGAASTNAAGPRVGSLRVAGVKDMVMDQQRRAAERQRTRYKSAPSYATPGSGSTLDSEPTTPVLGPITEESGRPEDRELLPRAPPAPGDSRHPLQAEMDRPRPPPLQRADAADAGTATPARSVSESEVPERGPRGPGAGQGSGYQESGPL
ncbi:sodium/hydrogen exchanger 2-like isoform X2 [Amphibalanus amphitrite]|uniref:sodium/hydrogen exchanger 2-like isoform X2 n=1 Tax=Amphibalanus amphitrite TaxID=1232801 RepID=UPI001C923548|nr:sodium/hydrogen exchanger 2-like isoform X2 [Amphibalanus amphitrite]